MISQEWIANLRLTNGCADRFNYFQQSAFNLRQRSGAGVINVRRLPTWPPAKREVTPCAAAPTPPTYECAARHRQTNSAR